MQPLGVMVSAATPSPEWLTRHPGPEPALRCSELSPGELPVLLASPQTGGSSRCRFLDNLIFDMHAGLANAAPHPQVLMLRARTHAANSSFLPFPASHSTREDRHPPRSS